LSSLRRKIDELQTRLAETSKSAEAFSLSPDDNLAEELVEQNKRLQQVLAEKVSIFYNFYHWWWGKIKFIRSQTLSDKPTLRIGHLKQLRLVGSIKKYQD